MTCHITAPSKTFFIGEYAVLHHGEALVLNTGPRFVLKIQKSPLIPPLQKEPNENISPFPAGSPAFKLFKAHPAALEDYNFEFNDPHQDQGGMGASSAQFLALATWLNHPKTPLTDPQLLALYHCYAYTGKGQQPSGADLLAQRLGGLTRVNIPKQASKACDWPFADLDYFLIRTGQKQATHTHLAAFAPLSFSESYLLHVLTEKAIDACRQQDSDKICNLINMYATALDKMQLVAPKTKKILAQFNKNSCILAAKGCGALGADVILLLTHRKNRLLVLEFLESTQLTILSYGQEMASGLNMIEDRSHDLV